MTQYASDPEMSYLREKAAQLGGLHRVNPQVILDLRKGFVRGLAVYLSRLEALFYQLADAGVPEVVALSAARAVLGTDAQPTGVPSLFLQAARHLEV